MTAPADDEQIGAIAVGMNTMLTPGEIEYILHDSRARIVIVHEALQEQFEKVLRGPFGWDAARVKRQVDFASGAYPDRLPGHYRRQRGRPGSRPIYLHCRRW